MHEPMIEKELFEKAQVCEKLILEYKIVESLACGQVSWNVQIVVEQCIKNTVKTSKRKRDRKIK